MSIREEPRGLAGSVRLPPFASEKSRDVELISEVVALRGYLIRAANLQLRDLAESEDVAQDVLLAAISGISRYERKSQLKTWLVGILKRKIVDVIRRRQKVGRPGVNTHPPDGGQNEDWAPGAGDVVADNSLESCGESRLTQKQFLSLLNAGLQCLPPKQRQAFVLREIHEEVAADVCVQMRIRPDHLPVLIYRARLVLQARIRRDWLSGAAGEFPRPA